MIYVSVKNVEYTLQVHSCSILQSVTAFSYPRIDDRIYFKGHPKVAGSKIYDLEIGLCYWSRSSFIICAFIYLIIRILVHRLYLFLLYSKLYFLWDLMVKMGISTSGWERKWRNDFDVSCWGWCTSIEN